MIPCTVTQHYGAYVVTTEFGSLLLQSDYDQASFAVNCGLLRSPSDWDGTPSTLDGWEDADLTDIDYIPDDYVAYLQ